MMTLVFILPLIIIGIWASYKIWIISSAYDWHQKEDQKQRRLLRPVHGTKEEIEHGLGTGKYIFWGNEIHRAEAHFPTEKQEYPTAFKVSWKIDKIINHVKEKLK